MNYWHIELYSGEIIKVKPDDEKIKYIQSLIAKQEGAITTPTRSIVVKDIKDFRLSDEVVLDQKLLEDYHQAFNIAQLNEDGEVIARWVKKVVPTRKWYSYYRQHSAYHILEEGSDHVLIYFKLPVHQVDHQLVQDLNSEELRKVS